MRHALGDRGSLTTIVGHLRAVRAREAEHRITSDHAPATALPDSGAPGADARSPQALGRAQRCGGIHHRAGTNARRRTSAGGERRRAQRERRGGRGTRRAGTHDHGACSERRPSSRRCAPRTPPSPKRTAHAGSLWSSGLERQRGSESLAEERRATIENMTAALERTVAELDDTRAALERARTEAEARERGLMDTIAAAAGPVPGSRTGVGTRW